MIAGTPSASSFVVGKSICRVCAAPLPQQRMGRPREFCSPECKRFSWALGEAESALLAVLPRIIPETAKPIRSQIVSELLNCLPVDVSAQPRDPSGRWKRGKP